MLSLSGKKILITGASSGIGKAIVEQAAEIGAKVVLMARREELMSEIVAGLKGDGHQYFAVDASDDNKVGASLKLAVSDGVPFDGFVHAAGSELTVPLKMLSRNAFEKVMSINTFAAFNISKILIQKGNFSLGGGAFVFIGSVMAALGQPAKTGYCASKGALMAGARAMALELAPKRIRVNTILPGMVKSEMSLGLLDSLDESGVKRIVEMHPLGIGEVTDVANVALFLLSDLGRWITGTSLWVDGGYSAM
ncbi:MAG: SDR family oxidoreductase [Chitinophagaceae bacterium]|nr:MAG: SDR family oxidoreductase [Chitinophagaceae bacterium]